MPVTHAYVNPVADDPAEAALNKTLPSHWNADHTIVDLENSEMAQMPPATLKGNDEAGDATPQDLTAAEVRTLLGLDATGTGAVDSVTAANASLTISPNTGAVLANINLGHSNIFTVHQDIKAAGANWICETDSTAADLTGYGAFYVAKNTAGDVGSWGATTTGYTNAGFPFLVASQIHNQSFGTGGMSIGAWQSDIVVWTANNTGNPRLAWTTTATGTTVYSAGSTAAGTAPIKLTSGALMTAAEAGAIEFLTDKFYGTISTGPARKELTLNDAALTSGRVPVTTTNGRLTTPANITWDGTLFTVTGAGTGNMIVGGLPTATQYSAVSLWGQLANVGDYNFASNSTDNSLYINRPSGHDIHFKEANGNSQLTVRRSGNILIGSAALATNATDGFLYIPTCPGAPSGTPTAFTGLVAMVFDTTNNKLMIYDGGWIGVTLS